MVTVDNYSNYGYWLPASIADYPPSVSVPNTQYPTSQVSFARDRRQLMVRGISKMYEGQYRAYVRTVAGEADTTILVRACLRCANSYPSSGGRTYFNKLFLSVIIRSLNFRSFSFQTPSATQQNYQIIKLSNYQIIKLSNYQITT